MATTLTSTHFMSIHYVPGTVRDAACCPAPWPVGEGRGLLLKDRVKIKGYNPELLWNSALEAKQTDATVCVTWGQVGGLSETVLTSCCLRNEWHLLGRNNNCCCKRLKAYLQNPWREKGLGGQAMLAQISGP